MSISTKTGDDGTTGLMFNRRVPKTDARVEAYGTVDELNASLGLIRATVPQAFITEKVFAIQKELVILMGELAVHETDRERYIAKGYQFVEEAMVDRLTSHIDDLEKNHKLSFKHWATPGATLGAAYLDAARTICRRAERRCASLAEQGTAVNREIIRYLNRLSDLCWLWARWVETQAEADA